MKTSSYRTFNFARWAAKRIRSKKNVDLKIFVVGGPGDGKSMTGVILAKRIAKWLSYFEYGDFDHINEFYKFDGDHVAVISTKDLLHVMSKRLNKNSGKILDDCGSSKGFTNRRSMSNENLDMVSIYGTNRTQNGYLIVCVQDVDFTDPRMKWLANVVIDLTDYYQDGPFRMAKLYKITKDKKRKGGIRLSRFMTYEHGEWVTIESIACFLPPEDEKKPYDDLRDAKEGENSHVINEKYKKIEKQEEIESAKPRCKYCNSSQLEYRKQGIKCGYCKRYQ